MKNDLQTHLNTALRDVDWHGEQQVLARIRQTSVGRGHPGRVLAFALLLLALAGTALAVGLHFSQNFSIQQQAKQAVMTKYGLTDEMMDLFTCEVETDGSARFTMQFANPERLGEYTATCTDGVWTATWSHDGTDKTLLESGDLSSPAWGASQLARLLPAYRQRAVNWSAVLDISQLTLEERAALDEPLLANQETGTLINIAPGEDDLPPEDAERLARSAIEGKYGTQPEGTAQVGFFLYGNTQRREYRVDLDGYVVYVDSPSGEITYCRWMVPAERRTLPQGGLQDYPEAREEFILSGAFDLLSAEDKAVAAKRYAEAGLDALLPWSDFVSPVPGELAESVARSMAVEALAGAYGLPEDWQSLFLCRTSLVLEDGQRVWVVEYLPYELTNWHFRDFEKLGEYTALVDGASGQVLSCTWSLDGLAVDGYTEENLADAPAFSGKMLPWVQALLEDLQAILDKYPTSINLNEMSLEDRGAYAARMRQDGYAAKTYPDLIPAETDIPCQQAADLAWETLNTMYDLTGMNLVRGEENQEGLYLVQLADESWARIWSIVYTDNVDIFTVEVHAETGEIENIWHDSPAFGNG